MQSDSSANHSRSNAWLPLVLMLAALILRVLRQHDIFGDTPNLSPLMAFAFTGAVVFPRTLPWWSWALLLMGFDFMTLGVSSFSIGAVVIYACFALAAWWGAQLRGKAGILDTLIRSLVCSVGFYLITNAVCWLTEPYYAKNFAGLVQALTVGMPGPYPTTLVFFRNSLTADMIGSFLLLMVYNAESLVRNLRAMPLFSTGGARVALD